ncbi:TPA: hypothetical protein LMR64_002707 [Vibrio alginolyticus]|nr:hypothetical protein [Vibrio alginolyticus]
MAIKFGKVYGKNISEKGSIVRFENVPDDMDIEFGDVHGELVEGTLVNITNTTQNTSLKQLIGQATPKLNELTPQQRKAFLEAVRALSEPVETEKVKSAQKDLKDLAMTLTGSVLSGLITMFLSS